MPLEGLKKLLKRKKLEETPALFEAQDEEEGQEETAAEEESKKPRADKSESKTLASKLKTSVTLNFPSLKTHPRLVKLKRWTATALGFIYLLAGFSMVNSPFAFFLFLSCYFMFDYVWIARRLKSYAELFQVEP